MHGWFGEHDMESCFNAGQGDLKVGVIRCENGGNAASRHALQGRAEGLGVNCAIGWIRGHGHVKLGATVHLANDALHVGSNGRQLAKIGTRAQVTNVRK